MGLNDTPSANRTHISFFGRRNAGKSSLMNAFTGQDIAVVSDIKGTTTDPVQKSMELLPLGPVIMIDTPGFDDEGALGDLRVKKTKQILNKTDIAVLVIDASEGVMPEDIELAELINAKKIPYVAVFNKSDISNAAQNNASNDAGRLPGAFAVLRVSAITKQGIYELKERIGHMISDASDKKIVGDLISPSDTVILVTPIDSAAPKGRMILPQQQTLRDVLDAGAAALVVKEDLLENAFKMLSKKPALVITDSQAFDIAARVTPEDVPLTSFSILMARYKGFLDTAVYGAYAIDSLEDGDTVLISEGCTHHRQRDDIGTVKIPRWLREYTGKKLNIKTSSGVEFPEDLSEYKLIIHCGACMLNEREVQSRMNHAMNENVHFTNYGTAIAYMKGILARSIDIFPHLRAFAEAHSNNIR